MEIWTKICTNYVFNFPSIYSTVWVDFSQLFVLLHTYLKHGTVMGSNICEWKQKYLWMDNFPSYLFVYRQAIPQLYIWFFYFPWDVWFHDLFDQELRIRKKYSVMVFVLVFLHNIFFQSSTHDQITHIFETVKVFLFNSFMNSFLCADSWFDAAAYFVNVRLQSIFIFLENTKASQLFYWCWHFR